MSNYARDTCLGGRILYGPEVVNGTGQVYVHIRPSEPFEEQAVLYLTVAETRELVAALTAAADRAEERWEKERR